MNKPLKDWTLGEIKAECDKRNAFCEANGSCPFFAPENEVFRCRIRYNIGNTFPGVWDLSEPPHWTKQEVEIAKALYELRRSVSLVIGRSTGGILWWRDGDRGEGILPHKLFPSLKEGNCVRLEEIIGGTE